MQIGDARVGVHHREGGPLRVVRLKAGLDLRLGRLRGGLQLAVEVAQAVVGVDAQLLEERRVLCEGVFEEHADGVAEHDGVRDLHHCGLQVQRKQQTCGEQVAEGGGGGLRRAPFGGGVWGGGGCGSSPPKECWAMVREHKTRSAQSAERNMAGQWPTRP